MEKEINFRLNGLTAEEVKNLLVRFKYVGTKTDNCGYTFLRVV